LPIAGNTNLEINVKEIPTHLCAYKKTDVFDQDSVPQALLKDHSTKAEVWGKIVILEGELLYSIPSQHEEYRLDKDWFGVVEPEVKHHVAPMGKVRFYVEFYK